MFYPWCLSCISFAGLPPRTELPRPIAVKLCHVIAMWVRLIVQVQKFGGPPQKEIGGQKRAKFGAISDNFRLRSRISPERVKISKIGKQYDNQRFLPRSTSPVNFGPPTTENWVWVWTHPNCIFRETIFRPLGGAGPSNFNTQYRLTKACYRTSLTGTGVPQKNLRAKM